MGFWPLALARPAQAAIENIAILTPQPPLSYRRARVGRQQPDAGCGRGFQGDAFTVNRQLSKCFSTPPWQVGGAEGVTRLSN